VGQEDLLLSCLNGFALRSRDSHDETTLLYFYHGVVEEVLLPLLLSWSLCQLVACGVIMGGSPVFSAFPLPLVVHSLLFFTYNILPSIT
jgi:hypothetical protein